MIGSNPARIFPEKAPDPNCSVLARLFSLGRFGLQSAGFRQTLASQIPADSGQSEERTFAMTKNELIAAVAGKASMTKTAAASAVDATFDAITAALKKGGEVKIMGFGHFRVVKRAAREGRNPRTGNPVKIKAARRPRFSAGKALKDAVNR
jgi:DNA-binding protein HU-beta